MTRSALLCLILLGMSSGLSAADPASEAFTKALGPVLDNQVIMVAHIDATKVDLENFLKLEEAVTGAVGRAIQRLEPIAADLKKRFLAAGGSEFYVTYSLTSGESGALCLAVPLSAQSNEAELVKVLGTLLGRDAAVGHVRVGQTLIVGNPNVEVRFGQGKLKSVARPEFAAGLTATGGTSFQIVFSPSADQRRVLGELAPPLPAELGNVTPTQLAKSVAWVAVAADVSAKPRGQFVVQAANASDATLVSDFLARLLKLAANLKSLPQSVQSALNSGNLAPRVSGTRIAITFSDENQGVKSMTALLTELTGEWWSNLCRVHVRDNLKMIGLAMYNQYDTTMRFASPANETKDGKHKVSWRVQILPFIDQAELYAKYKQDEPWDSKHNLSLLPQMPEIYATLDQDVKSGQTTFQMPANPGMIGGNLRGITVKDVTDGTVNTIMVMQVDVAKEVPWTKPQDFEVDLKDPWKGLLSPGSPSAAVLMMDGSARRLTKAEVGDNLIKFLTIAGGEVVN